MQSVYLTSGSDRLFFEARRVEVRPAPSWLLAGLEPNAGTVIHAVAWLGPNEVEESGGGTPRTTRYRSASCHAHLAPRPLSTTNGSHAGVGTLVRARGDSVVGALAFQEPLFI